MNDAPSRPAANKEGSRIGPSLKLKGTVSADENFAIAGEFEGDIDNPKHELVVTEGAVVKANIRASKVQICGKLHGDVQGVNRVELTGTAEMAGKLQTREIRVEEGAVFRGQVDIITDRD